MCLGTYKIQCILAKAPGYVGMAHKLKKEILGSSQQTLRTLLRKPSAAACDLKDN